MPTIELNVLVIALAAIVPAVLAYLIQVSRIRSLKGKILDQEYEMVKTHTYVLELEKENVELRKDSKSQNTAGVISINDKSKVAAG
jgi:hypothetical protein